MKVGSILLTARGQHRFEVGVVVMIGGRRSLVVAVLGAVFLSLTDNVIPMRDRAEVARQVIYGAIALISISAYVLAQRARGQV